MDPGIWPVTEEPIDLDAMIAERLGPGGDADVSAEALAILIDADLSEEQRGAAFAQVLQMLMSGLSPHETVQFVALAREVSLRAAMAYLAMCGRFGSSNVPGQRGAQSGR